MVVGGGDGEVHRVAELMPMFMNAIMTRGRKEEVMVVVVFSAFGMVFGVSEFATWEA